MDTIDLRRFRICPFVFNHFVVVIQTTNLFLEPIFLQCKHFKRIQTHFHTLIFIMQHIPEKKRKIDTTPLLGGSTESLETIPTEEHFMFLQIIDEYPSNYLVKIDPVQDKIIYEDLLEFEKSKVTIQMDNYQPETLYMLYEGNVCHPERFTAWKQFFMNICLGKTPDKTEYIQLDRDNLHKIQKARWFVCHRMH